VGIYALLVQLAGLKSFPVYKEGVILVTGASKGIGKHAAVALAKEGYHVFGAVRTIPEGLPEHKNLQYILMDVTNDQQIDDAYEFISHFCQESNLPFVALVNNAGIAYYRPIEGIDKEEMKKLYDVNVFGLVTVSSKFIPLVRKTKGRIVNIGSIAGRVSVEGCGVYCGSKFAVEAINDAMRKELNHFDISVSLIEPGYIKTEILQSRYENDVFNKLSSEHKELYKQVFFDSFEKEKARLKKAGEIEESTEAIINAISSPYPKTRYPISNVNGIPTHFFILTLPFLPDRITDFISKYV